MSAYHALDNDHSGLLSDATLTALNLHHQPFTSVLRDALALSNEDADDIAPFSDAVTEEQLSDIKQALITGDDLLLILGESGAGKSTLLQQLNDNSGLRIQCFPVTGSDRFSTQTLFAGMLEAFKRAPPDKLKDILDELIPSLQAMVGRNTLSVIVLDDAHRVDQSELTQLLSAMLYVNSQDETLMRVALAATIDFEDSIPDLLPDGADLPYASLTIEGFIPARAAAYLDYRLQLAGFDQEFPFTERDMASLVDHSDGKPGELHALTADVLNEKYGRVEEPLPYELKPVDEGQGFMQSRTGKLALGALATVLIIGGLLLFLPPAEQHQLTDPANVDVAALTESTQSDASQPQLNDQEAPPADSLQLEAALSDVADNTVDAPAETTAETTTETGTEIESVAENITETRPPSLWPRQRQRLWRTLRQTGEDNPTVDNSPDTLSPAPSEDESQVAALGNSDSQGTVAGNTQQAAGGDSTQASGSEATGEQRSLTVTQAQSEDSDALASSAADTQTIDNEQLAVVEPPPASDITAGTGPASAAALPADDQVPGVANPDPEIAALLESPSWILVQDESQYTIQMSASRDLTSVQNFLRRHSLPLPNSIFSFERDGDVWYALVHGIFPTLTEARQAVERMPAAAQRDQPWIREVGRVKQIMR